MSFEGVLAVVGFLALALVIVVLNDWWKRRLPRPQIGPHRLRELNQPQGFFQKLWTTFLLLVFAALIVPLLFVGLQLPANPVLQEGFKFILEATGVFYLVLLIYIWWRPRWLAYLYGMVESRLVATAYVVTGMIVIGSAITVLAILVLSWLR